MMGKFFVGIRFVIIVLFFSLVALGCGKDEKPEAAKVVSKKVVSKKAAITNAKKIARSAPPVKAVKKSPPRHTPGKIEKSKAKIESEMVLTLAPPAIFYNPQGKIDPFEPIFRDKPAVEKVSGKKGGTSWKMRVPRTPLEKIALNQLTLTAVILRRGGNNRALVEEASGKGYVIKKGTSMGTRWGRVVEIKKEMVVVEEETENMLGEVVLNRREMKLQKPFGDD